MKKQKSLLAIVLCLSMILSIVETPAPVLQAAAKKAKITISNKNLSVTIKTTKNIQVKTKNVKKITAIKATSSKKANIKVTKIKKYKKSGRIAVKALKKKTAKIKITVKYIASGSKKVKTKKFTVTVKGVAKKSKPTKAPAKTEAPTKKPNVTPVVTATPVGTATPVVTATPVITATPTVEPTQEPTKAPTATPTATPSVTVAPANIVSMEFAAPVPDTALNDPNIRITLDRFVKLDDYSVNVSYVKQNTTTSIPLFANVTYIGNNTYNVDPYNGYEEYQFDTGFGDIYTITIDSLTGTTKTMSATWKNPYDNTTQTRKFYLAESETPQSFHQFTFVDSEFKNTYFLTENLTFSAGSEDYDTDIFTLTTEIDSSLNLSVDCATVGTYTFPVIATDENNVSFTINLEFNIYSTDSFTLDTKENVYIFDTEEITTGDNFTIGNIYGCTETSSCSVVPVENDTNQNVACDINLMSNDLILSGTFTKEQTYTINLTDSSNEEKKASFTINVKPMSQVQISGKVNLDSNINFYDVNGRVTFTNSLDLTNAACLNQPSTLDSSAELDEDGNYETTIYSGSYTAQARITLFNEFYYSNQIEVNVEHSDLTDVDFTYAINPRKVRLEFEGKGLYGFDEDGNLLDNYSLSTGTWYDLQGNIYDKGKNFCLLPGTYNLFSIDAILSNEDGEDEKLYSITASFTVSDEDITVTAYVSEITPTIYGELKDDKTALNIQQDLLNTKIISFTPETSGVYSILAKSQDTNLEISFYLWDEEFSFLAEIDQQNTGTLNFEAGKTYYINRIKAYNNFAVGNYTLSCEKDDMVTITGTLTDANNNPLTFTEDTIPSVCYFLDSNSISGTMNLDGSFSVSVIKNKDEDNITFEFASENYYHYIETGYSEDTNIGNIPFYTIELNKDSEYPLSTVESNEFTDEAENEYISAGNMLYIPVSIVEETPATFNLFGYVYCTEEDDYLYTEVSFTLPTDTEATIDIKGTWEPASYEVATTEEIATSLNQPKWVKFTPEESGHYTIYAFSDSDNPESTTSEYEGFYVYSDKRQTVSESDYVLDEETGIEKYLFELEEGKSYYISFGEVYDENNWQYNNDNRTYKLEIQKYTE